MSIPILEIKHISKSFGDFEAVREVTFSLNQGETFGLVGESGSGKTTLANMIIGIDSPTAGDIVFKGARLWEKSKWNHARKGKIQMVFQDPRSSLDPRMTVGKIVTEPLIAFPYKVRKGKGNREDLIKLLSKVGLQEQCLDRFPHEFSGGQRQRIAIARALITEPELIVLDEPTSALDVSVQAQVLNLLKDLQKENGLTYLFISHDMGVIQYMSDHIGVLLKGKIVESGPTRELFANPRREYTQKLIASIPKVCNIY